MRRIRRCFRSSSLFCWNITSVSFSSKYQQQRTKKKIWCSRLTESYPSLSLSRCSIRIMDRDKNNHSVEKIFFFKKKKDNYQNFFFRCSMRFDLDDENDDHKWMDFRYGNSIRLRILSRRRTMKRFNDCFFFILVCFANKVTRNFCFIQSASRETVCLIVGNFKSLNF